MQFIGEQTKTSLVEAYIDGKTYLQHCLRRKLHLNSWPWDYIFELFSKKELRSKKMQRKLHRGIEAKGILVGNASCWNHLVF